MNLFICPRRNDIASHRDNLLSSHFSPTVQSKPINNPLPTPPNKPSLSKILQQTSLATFVPNSTGNTNAGLITTQFPSVPAEDMIDKHNSFNESTANIPISIQRKTPSPPPPAANKAVNENEKMTPPSTISQGKGSSPERSKTNIQRPLSSSIFVPPPTVPTISNVRLSSNIEVGRLQLEDITQSEEDNIYESYVEALIEEVIQSDFEKPSIPEVILAVITDLTNDNDVIDEPMVPVETVYSNGTQHIYNFGQEKGRSTSPVIVTGNNTNININSGEIDCYYTRVQQTVSHVHDGPNQDSMPSNNTSSNQVVGQAPIVDGSSNHHQVMH